MQKRKSGWKSLPEKVADELIQYIIDQNLEPGDKLPTEPELAAMLNVGRGTVREAVRALISRNILVIRRGAGTFVAERVGVMDDPFGIHFVKDKHRLAMEILQMRLILEPEIAAYAAHNASEADIAELERLCQDVEMRIHAKQDHALADEKLHTAIARASGNSMIAKLMTLVHLSIEMFIDLTHQELLTETIETHRDIVNSIRTRDSQQARDAMRLHLLYNKHSLEKYGRLEQKPAE